MLAPPSAWSAAVGLVSLVTALSLTGCGNAPFSTTALHDSQSSPAPAQAAATASASRRAQPALLRKALGQWYRALSKSGTTPAVKPATAAATEVSIDVRQIARRHPAWRLADALEHAGHSNVQMAAPQVERIRFAPPLPLGPLEVAAPVATAGFDRDAQPVEVTNLVRLQVQARTRQDRAIDAFVADVAGRQQAARAQRATNLRAALQEDVAVARRLTLAELQPGLPPDPIQLEMTNLRLDLLRNVQRTPQARERAVQRLHELEAQWTATVGKQAAARLEELRQAREEHPLEVQREGETRIQATIADMAQRDAAVREDVLQSQRARVEQDLTADEARLGIVLPAAALPPQAVPGLASPATVNQNSTTVLHISNKVKTSTAAASSTGNNEARIGVQASNAGTSVAATAGRAAQIRALRAQAWHDARRWARLTAQRQGWTWVETTHSGGVPAPDRTNAVLRILFLS